jgi:hypothetical protein
VCVYACVCVRLCACACACASVGGNVLRLRPLAKLSASSGQAILRLVARVHPKVPRECLGLRKGLTACVARVGLVAGVHPKVHRECHTSRAGLPSALGGAS